MSYDQESATTYTVALDSATVAQDLGFFAPEFTVYLTDLVGASGSVTVEVSPDGVNWFVPQNSTIVATVGTPAEGDNAATFRDWARQLRFTRSGITGGNAYVIARKAAR